MVRGLITLPLTLTGGKAEETIKETIRKYLI